LWQVKDATEFRTAVNAAVKAGYRHFDTAQYYENEGMLGDAWTDLGLKREDIFITTKIKNENFGKQKTLGSIDDSLKRLKTGYVDLLLLH
ncbi:aldo/keto reductase, partial [Bacillus cereus group sp. BC330]|uniref:aldo/keto reductase n=1 Tax=Bacillus cereus group sp. BC330 TaxID=3445306 RepID=UPI003F225E80